MQCDQCAGTGKTEETRRFRTGTFQGIGCCREEIIETYTYMGTCSKCNGTGYYHYVNVVHWCSGCNGTGQRNEQREIIKTYPTGRQLPTGQYTNEVVTCSSCSGSGRETRSESRPGKGQEDNKKEGCFITTAVCNEFDILDADVILNKFRAFRDNWLANEQGGTFLISQYYDEAPRILDKLDSAKYNETMKYIWDVYLSKCLSMIEKGENDQALEIYQEMFYFLKNKTEV